MVFPGSKIDGILLNSYLICISRDILGQVNKSLTNINHKNRKSWPLSQFLDLSQIPGMKRGEAGSPWRRTPVFLPKMYTVTLSPSPPQRDQWPFPRVHWEKGHNYTIWEILDAHSRRPKTSLWYLGDFAWSRGLWTWGDQWRFRSDLLHSGLVWPWTHSVIIS